MLYLTGQKRGMSELNLVWPVILTGVHAAVISSPVIIQPSQNVLAAGDSAAYNGISATYMYYIVILYT